MERQYNQLKKEQYAKKLAQNGNLERAKEVVSQDDYLPILKPVEIHPETEISNENLNAIFNDIGADLDIINSNLSITSARFKNLLETTRSKLDSIKQTLRTEKERQEDIRILCNKYTDFSNILLLSDKNTSGTAEYTDNVFMLPYTSYKNVQAEVIEVTGNGYAGNSYVYNNEQFASAVSDSSNTSYMVDKSLITYFEYSRITANNSEKEVFPLVNFDSIFARCSITLKANKLVNILELSTETDDVVIESLSTSNDGITFTETSLKNVAIKDKTSRFKSDDYIFGSGILSFKDCQYIKLVLRSTKNTNDTIAFTKKNSENNKEIIKLHSAKRSAIKINNIKLGQRTNKPTAQINISNFLTDSASSLAIFANEYAADGLNLRNSIQYTLTVNGLDYDIIPINSQYNGKKIIRTTSNTIPAEHVHYLTETAKNATLTINMKSTDKSLSPYISDLKILIGGE